MSTVKYIIIVKLVILLVMVLVGLSWTANPSLNEEEFSAPHFVTTGRPTMTFLYCFSCGYRKAFEDYVNLISEKYPEISINGANYSPPELYLYTSKAVLAVKLILILIIITSYDMFGAFGYVTPSWWRFCSENKLYSCMMIFFVGNMLEAQLISSGAFEITLNDVPVWSKIQTGRIPSPQELFQIIDSHLQFSANKIQKSEFIK